MVLLTQQRANKAEAIVQTLLPVADPLDSKLIAFLSAQGLSTQDIADKLEIEPDQVTRVLSLPSTTRMVFKIQSVLRLSPEQMLEAALPRAVEKKIYLMMHGQDEKVQSANATEIIDRTRGKPVQTMITGKLPGTEELPVVESNLASLQERLEKLENQKKDLLRSRGAVIDVEEGEK